MSIDFDVHDHRTDLKQLKDTGDTKLYDNRTELSCPACGEPFAKLFVTRQEATRFPKNDGAPFCLLRRDTDVLVFRH